MNHRLIFSNAQLTIMGMGVILSVFLCLGVEGWAQFTPPEPPTLPKEVFQSPNPIIPESTETRDNLGNPVETSPSPPSRDSLKSGSTPSVPIKTLPSPPPVIKPVMVGVNGTYQDIAGRFKVGIISGFSVIPLADGVLMESPSGDLAYTALWRPRPNGLTGSQVSQSTLAQIVQQVFQRGENFQLGAAATSTTELNIPWSGSLTVGGKPIALQGRVIARSVNEGVLILLLVATPPAVERIEGMIATLNPTFQSK